MSLWLGWLIAAAVLGVAEVLTTTLALGLIAVGALAAALTGALGGSALLQVVVFVLASLAGIVLIRPVAMRRLHRRPALRTGAAALIGEVGYVLEDVTPHAGRIRIGGEEWSARPYDEASVIAAGSKVDVLQIKGATALVHPRELNMTAGAIALLIVAVLAAALVVIVVSRCIWLVPPARARNVERLGQFHKTMQPGLNFVIPMIDRVKDLIDLREQVVSFTGQRVITEDNVVVSIDTVLFFQVTDPRAADYEIVNYIQAIEQLAATMLRSVIGSMDLEQTLTSRDKINTLLRGVLDDASGKWGIRVTRVEIRSIDPPQSIKDAMEKQLKAEREKRAAILHAEGLQQSQVLTAEGDKKGAVLRAEGEKQSAILRAEGQAQAIATVFESIHAGNADPKLLAYQYLQTLPQLAQGQGNTVWMIPSELTGALRMLSAAFGQSSESENEIDAGAGRASAARRGPQVRVVDFDPQVPSPRSGSEGEPDRQ